MIQVINAPDNVAAFRAMGVVTKKDCQSVVIPSVKKLEAQLKEVNFLLVVDPEIENFTTSKWMEDILLDLKKIGKWNRAAVVCDFDNIISFSNSFNYIIPGEFRGFKTAEFNQALNWVEGN
jgi:hypothetical protein